MASRSRRWLLRAAALAAGTGAAGAWYVFRPPPDRWGEPIPFLTDESVFYDKWSAKRHDPVFWYHAAKNPNINPLGWAGDDKGFSLELRGTGWSETLDSMRVRGAATDGGFPLLKTMRCSGDRPELRLASNGVWTGVPLADFLEPHLRKTDRRIRIHGADGFTANLRLDDLATRDGRPSLLAFLLNGSPLSHERGGPIRLVVPDRFGFKSIKWPRRIEVTADDSPWGNHEVDTEGGTDGGWVTLGSKILRPDLQQRNPIATTKQQTLLLQGVAFGGLEPVEAVRVRIGAADQPWQSAELDRPAELTEHWEARKAWDERGRAWPLPDVWTPWSLEWTPPGPGDYPVAVRAVTPTGATQPEQDVFYRDADSSVAMGTLRVV